MKKVLKIGTLMAWGGLAYFGIELLWRGYSHPAMILVGAVCFLAVGALNEYLPWTMSIVLQALVGAVVITAVEFVSGCILNIWLNLGIWDYTGMPLNLWGQICLPFCGLWVILAVVGILLDDYLRHYLFDEERPHYTVF